MNKVILIGRLCRDPELTISANGTNICKFYIAVDKLYNKDKESSADFLPIVFFGKRAEAVAKFFKKGNKIAVSGRLENNNYTKDDKKIYSYNIIADSFDFCEKNNKNEQEASFVPYESSDDIDEGLPF